MEFGDLEIYHGVLRGHRKGELPVARVDVTAIGNILAIDKEEIAEVIGYADFYSNNLSRLICSLQGLVEPLLIIHHERIIRRKRILNYSVKIITDKLIILTLSHNKEEVRADKAQSATGCFNIVEVSTLPGASVRQKSE